MQYYYFVQFNPIMFSIGPVSFYWYGMMYSISFMFSSWFLTYRMHNVYCCNFFWNKNKINYLLYLSFFGILLGGRIGYVLCYHWHFFTQNFFWILKIWEGGMSFHGGLMGVIISIKWFSYRTKQSFLQVSDFIVPAVPVGLGLGRLGNFINGELWGRVSTDVPWAMLFPNALTHDLILLENHPQWQFLFDYYGALPRHPSQLYEMIFEGILLFIIINIFILRIRSTGSVSSLFLICYGVFRIIIEFFREPDIHLGLIGNFISVGQILSVPMFVGGLIIMYRVCKK